MSSIFFFATDRLKQEGQTADVQNGLNEKLREISEQIKKDGVSIPDVLRPLTQHSIMQCLVGNNHLAFRLEDGRVCRVSYSLRSDASPKGESRRKPSQSDSSASLRDGISSRGLGGQCTIRSYRQPLSTISRTSRGISFLREMQRHGIYIARSVTSQIPASEVPENLIEECQTVLEGKSRDVIIRELQHTNLDVNMAVNNLLSRDDEAEQSNGASGDGGPGGSAADDWDDDPASDLLSFFEYPESQVLFDSSDLIADELIEPPTSPRLRGELASEIEGNLFGGRRKRRRLEAQNAVRTSEPYHPRLVSGSESASGRASNLDSLAPIDTVHSEGKTTQSSARQTVQLGDHLEFWPGSDDCDADLRFSCIAALHSELVGLSINGELHQWRWSDARPFPPTVFSAQSSKKSLDSAESNSAKFGTTYYHPRTPSLELLNERITVLAGCSTRATVMTASGKFASWVDESLSRLLPSSSQQPGQSAKLLCFEHRASLFHELREESVVQLTVAPLVTVVRCRSGAAYWWGIYPPGMRQRTIEKSRQHNRPTVGSRSQSKKSTQSSNRNSRRSSSADQGTDTTSRPSHRARALDVSLGSFVRMKSAPIFHAGAIGFTVAGGVPKVGILLEDAWHITDNCRFRVSPTGIPAGGQDITSAVLSNNSAAIEDTSQHASTCPHALAAAAAASNHPTSTLSTSASPNPSLSSSELFGNNNANNLNFQEMPPPPSPASSTCSDQSGPVRVSPGTFKRKKVSSTSSDRGDRATSDGEQGSAGGGSRSSRGRSADHDLSNLISIAVRRLTGHNNESNESNVKPPSVVTEEDWSLTDVVFVEDGRTQPVGIVLKVDGNIAAVKFLKDQERACLASNCPYSPVCSLVNSIVQTGQSASPAAPCPSGSSAFPDPMAWVNDCRLLRKDFLTVVRYGDSSRVPEFVQRTPKRIFAFPTQPRNSTDKPTVGKSESNRLKLLCLSPENNRVHTIVELGHDMQSQQSQLAYHMYNLSGKLLSHHKLPSQLSSASVPSSEFSLISPAQHPLLLLDSRGLVIPFTPSNRSAGHDSVSMTPPSTPFDLPPVQCAAFSWTRNQQSRAAFTRQTSKSSGGSTDQASSASTQSLFGLIVVRDLTLMQHVLRANDTQIERLLSTSSTDEDRGKKLSLEMVDGQRNLLHMAVTMCAPRSNRETSQEWIAKLDPILSDRVNLNSEHLSSVRISEKMESSADKPVYTSRRPPSALWSTINRPSSHSTNLSMHELFIRSSIEAATAAAAAAANAAQSDDHTAPRPPANGTNFWHWPPIRKDDLSRRIASYRIVRLLVESPQLRPHLSQLLKERNTESLTPFMLAVKCRAYAVARFLYEAIHCILTPDGTDEPLKDFVFPLDSRPDDSPLYQLCCNDTCSFTWTGPDHIRQDIFECRTCGLMDSLCCCTECARVCHRGHDCRLKRTSPTAYCDCWEKCRCQSLISGSQPQRQELFYRLLEDTELIRLVNSRNEHLMLFLIKRVERQLREQKQHRPTRRRLGSLSSSSNSNSRTANVSSAGGLNQASNWDVMGSASGTSTPDEPDHDLDPPRFARDALELSLDCPGAVESIMNMDLVTVPSHVNFSTAEAEDESLLFTQAGSTLLDDFVFTLICKCPPELVDILVNTLNRLLSLNAATGVDTYMNNNTSSSQPGHRTIMPFKPLLPVARMRQAACRFVRSVARIYTSLALELAADHKKKKGRILMNQPAPLDLCRHIFTALAPVALSELPKLAMGLLTPIRSGTLRPSIPFSLVNQPNDAVQGLEQLFLVARNATNRRQLIQWNDLHRRSQTNSTAGVSEWRRLIVHSSAEESRPVTVMSYSSRPTSNPSTTAGTSRPLVVSTLSVNLASPTRLSSFSRYSNSPSPPISGSMDDPSLFTRQMQSTIRDIDQDMSTTDAQPTTAAYSSFQSLPSHLHDHEYSRPEGAPPPPLLLLPQISRGELNPQEESDSTASEACRPSYSGRTRTLPDENDSDPVPSKRRRTINRPSSVSSSPSHSPGTETPLHPSDDLYTVGEDEEDNTHTLSLLADVENSASQASSTNATIATFGGSTLDNLDAASDGTNFSFDIPMNVTLRGSQPTASNSIINGEQVAEPEQNQFNYRVLMDPTAATGQFEEQASSLDNAASPTTDPAGVSNPNDTIDEDEEEAEADEDTAEVIIRHEDDEDDTLIPAAQSAIEDNSDGQVSDFDDDDDEDDGRDDEEGEEEEDDENETDDDEEVDDDGYDEDEDGDDLGEPDEEDEDNDDSSHHSDASSVDAGSRSASPMWVPWSRSSVFSRLTSRNSTASGGPATTEDGTATTGSRRAVTESNPSTTSSTTATTTSTSHSLASSYVAAARRTVQSVLGLLTSSVAQSTSTNNTPTFVISGGSGAPVSSTAGESSSKSSTLGSASTEGACVIHTQVHLSRAFGLLLRVVADLISEVRAETDFESIHPLRRCASVPLTTLPPPSVYQQQRLLPIYQSSTSSTSSTSNNTLLLSSPMSTTHLPSVTLASRPIGPSLHDLHTTLQCLGSSSIYPGVSSSRAAGSHVIVSKAELVKLVAAIGVALTPVWLWLSTALDNLEAQLRYTSTWDSRFKRGNSTDEGRPASNQEAASRSESIATSTANVPTPRRPLATSSGRSTGRSSSNTNQATESNESRPSAPLAQRSDLLRYLFSIMRASTDDHGDAQPDVDSQPHKHLAYVLDALLYFFKSFENAWPSGLTHQLHNMLEKQTSSLIDLPADVVLDGLSDTKATTAEEPSGTRVTAYTGPPLTGRIAQREDPFFRRSESVLSLSGLGLDLIETPLPESLPLALQPQRLHPKAPRSELFGQTRMPSNSNAPFAPLHMNAAISEWGLQIAAGGRRTEEYLSQLTGPGERIESDYINLSRRDLYAGSGLLDSIGHSATLLSRWCLSLEFFARHFSGDVGAEHRSHILELGGFLVKEVRFRKQMERLRMSSRRDLLLTVDRERESLILSTIKQLNAEFARRQSQAASPTPSPLSGFGRYSLSSSRQTGSSNPVAVALLLGTTAESPLLGTLFGASSATPTPAVTASNQSALLSSHRLKVTFRDEPGEGSGVARSFFTAFTEAVLSTDVLPQLTTLVQSVTTSVSTPTSQSTTPLLFHHRHYTSMSRASPTSRSQPPLLGSSGFRSTSFTSASRSSDTATTPTTSSVSISFYPSTNRLVSRRARTSAWRRAGGLSASATPFYPTTSDSDTRSTRSRDRSPLAEIAVASSPAHAPGDDSAFTVMEEGTPIPGLSPGASPSRQDTSARTSSLYSTARTRSPTPELVHRPPSEDSRLYTSIGNRLFTRVQSVIRSDDDLCARITGMLMELPAGERYTLLANEDALQNRVEEARAVLLMSAATNRERSNQEPPVSTQQSQPILERLVNWREGSDGQKSDPNSIANESVASDVERVPLFWQPGLQGYYFPRAVPGLNVACGTSVDPVRLAARYSIYRGIGRMIGLCLLTNDTCPLQLSRPVLNYILGRVLHWHDFAFYDPTTYEGLRQLLHSASPGSSESVADYHLTFSLIPAPEEGGSPTATTGAGPSVLIGQQTYYLVPNGDQVEVTNTNVYEFVKRYTEFKMREAVREPLEQLRLGVFDVLPRNALDGLTAEDLRLLLNGAGEIDVEVLASYTTFQDETGGASTSIVKALETGTGTNHMEKVARLKRWFWSTVRSMDVKQRQNLLYFWTSSPALPASAQGFQPMPTITIRPPDDHHLPTANTCISRLYLPLYSSKQILRDKLFQAIETKSFGFV